MEIKEKIYKSYIKEKEVAKNIYNAALASGQSAGLVEATARDSKEFTVSVNIEPETVAMFTLTYEEMLVRVHDQYELILNICPGQIVRNLNVEVHITESRPLRLVKTPPLRSGNDISTAQNEAFLNPSSDIQMKNPKTAIVKFRPNARDQKKFAHYLETGVINGLSGQFVLQYDVERDPQDGEVLLQDGYFVHYLAPNDLDPLPKHVVFVLDTSGSMGGHKITQLKDAMRSILGEIRKEDMISIIEFNSRVLVWDINTMTCHIVPQIQNLDFLDRFYEISELTLPDPTCATETMIDKAKIVIEKMFANGGTYMIGALHTALYMVNVGQKKFSSKSGKCQPIIVFLTDGQPNVVLSSTEQIVEIVTSINKDTKVPIFSLSFGVGADKNFLRKLSLKNQGFSRHIYEASDASLQLQQFYKQISSPLLSDIKFKYDSEVEEVTRTCFPIYFRGSELVVSGRFNGSSFPTLVHCLGPIGPITIKSTVEKPATSLERLWAYLTVKQLLEEMDLVDDKTKLTRKAVALALKYSFVTDVTSLVVVKPTETNTLDTNTAQFGPQFGVDRSASFGTPSGPLPFIDLSARHAFGPFGAAPAPPAQSALFGSAAAPAPPAVFGSSGVFTPGIKKMFCAPMPQGHFGSTAAAATRQGFGFSPAGQAPSLPPPLFASGGTNSPSGFAFGSGGIPTVQARDIFGEKTIQFSQGPTGWSDQNTGLITGQGFTFGSERLSGQVLDTFEKPLNLKKGTEEFLADRPFHIYLQYKKDNKVIILFQGRVSKPRC